MSTPLQLAILFNNEEDIDSILGIIQTHNLTSTIPFYNVRKYTFRKPYRRFPAPYAIVAWQRLYNPDVFEAIENLGYKVIADVGYSFYTRLSLSSGVHLL